jgi:protein-S-isoprenylcysteine O-methyltransferase Ste14
MRGPLLARHPGQPLTLILVQDINALLVGAFYLLLLGVVLLRPPARGRARWYEGAIAMFGSFVLVLALPLLHGPPTPPALQGLSDLVIALGLLITVWGLWHLRLNFSIVPQVRGLSLGGPYRWVRHPMYLGEMVTAAGIVLFAPAPVQLLLFGLFIASQVARTYFEERGLRDAFVDYREHQRHSWRLLPFVY